MFVTWPFAQSGMQLSLPVMMSLPDTPISFSPMVSPSVSRNGTTAHRPLAREITFTHCVSAPSVCTRKSGVLAPVSAAAVIRSGG
jgi:hypothetical protein